MRRWDVVVVVGLLGVVLLLGIAAWAALNLLDDDSGPVAATDPALLATTAAQLRGLRGDMEGLGALPGSDDPVFSVTDGCSKSSGVVHNPWAQLEWQLSPDHDSADAAAVAAKRLSERGWTVDDRPDEFGQYLIQIARDEVAVVGVLAHSKEGLDLDDVPDVHVTVSIDRADPCGTGAWDEP